MVIRSETYADKEYIRNEPAERFTCASGLVGASTLSDDIVDTEQVPSRDAVWNGGRQSQLEWKLGIHGIDQHGSGLVTAVEQSLKTETSWMASQERD